MSLAPKTELYIDVRKTLFEKSEEGRVIGKQLLRCATATGAMVQEAQSAHSRKDFIAKLEIGLKELRESIYWTCLLVDSGYLTQIETEKLRDLQTRCLKSMITIVKTTKSNPKS